MAALTLPVLLIAATVFFFLLVAARPLGLKVCAACGAFASSWIIALGLRTAGWDVDPLLIGILMGGCVVGTLYLAREKLPEQYQLFTLPYLATLYSLVYVILGGRGGSAYLILAILWASFGSVFVLRARPHWSAAARRLIECCKNW